MVKYCFLLTLVLFSFSMTAISQTIDKPKMDVNKDIDLVKVYENYVSDGYGTAKIYQKLANANYFKNNYSEAKKWFEKLFDLEMLKDPTLRFRYKQSLKALNLNPEDSTYLSIVGAN